MVLNCANCCCNLTFSWETPYDLTMFNVYIEHSDVFELLVKYSFTHKIYYLPCTVLRAKDVCFDKCPGMCEMKSADYMDWCVSKESFRKNEFKSTNPFTILSMPFPTIYMHIVDAKSENKHNNWPITIYISSLSWYYRINCLQSCHQPVFDDVRFDNFVWKTHQNRIELLLLLLFHFMSAMCFFLGFLHVSVLFLNKTWKEYTTFA